MIRLLGFLAMTAFLAAPASADIRFAYLESAETGVNAPLVTQTVRQLQATFRDELIVRRLPEVELRHAVEHNELDLFLASSAFYRQMLGNSARDIATAQSTRATDPNHSEGSVFLVRGERLDLMGFTQLRNKRIGFSRAFGFSGYASAVGELWLRGLPTDGFFKEVKNFPADPRTVLTALRDKTVDAVVLPTCLLEWFTERESFDTSWLRVLEPRQEESLRCVHSTALYPNLTLASLPSLPPAHSRQITQTLLNMPAVDGNLFWSIATDFQWIDNLLRHMELDPWAKERQTTILSLIQKYRLYLAVLFAGLLLVGAHGLILSLLVKRRTAELSNALVEQKKLREQAQIATRRIERLQKIGVIGQMSTLFAHELGQPLNAVICYSFGLKKLLKQTPCDVQLVSQAAEEIEHQAERANAIVDKVRDYVRSRTDKKATTDWRECLHHALHDFKVTQSYGGAIELNAPTSVWVTADALELELIAINLMRNAAEAQTHVRQPIIRLSLTQSEGAGVLSVTDAAPPIDEQKFRQLLHEQQSSKPNGLGLGLSIVRTLVDMHGGKTLFTRSDAGGLKVLIRIPLASPSDGALYD